MIYNPDFIHGFGVDVSRYAAGNVINPDIYNVIVSVNGDIRGKFAVLFRVPQEQANAEPCFTHQELTQIGVMVTSAKSVADEECRFLSDWIPNASAHFEFGELTLAIKVPQLYVQRQPRGYIDPSLWESGGATGFLDYNANLYSTFQGAHGHSGRVNTHAGSMMVTGGVNVGEWRLRKRMGTTLNQHTSPQTQHLYGYAARDIATLKSQLILGDNNTQGTVFDSYSLRGVGIYSDDRMLPDSLRNYAPVLRGVAETNAQVIVMQHGQKIFETTMPPGPFELSDIGTMSYGGDLELVVTESDGRQRRQSFSFSLPPMLLHEGTSRFALYAGELHDGSINETPRIVQGVWHHGVNSIWTLYGGSQLAENYRSYAGGNAFNTPIGGVSFDVTHAQSNLGGGKKTSGNSYQVNYTKHLDESKTNLTLAAYRYSTHGFYTFREASQIHNDRLYNLDNDYFNTRHRFSASLSQWLTDEMSMHLTSNIYTYWGDRATSRNYIATFNHSLRNMSYGVSIMRSRNEEGKEENSYLLSMSLPFGNDDYDEKPLFNSSYTTLSHDAGGGTQLQSMVHGMQGEQNETSYSLGAATGNQGSDNSVSGNLSHSSSVGQFSASASVNNRNRQQLSASANGSLVIHRGGLTAGPAVGEMPFAIVEAKGAEGAGLLNGRGSHIDSRGYAIVPSLSAYRRNTISLNVQGLPDTVDVLENEKAVIPRAGMAIPVAMKTITGRPLILIVRDRDNEFLPIGTELQNRHGDSFGVIGQGGQAFIRGWDKRNGVLYAQVGKKKLMCRSVLLNAQDETSDKNLTQIMQQEVKCLSE
ncbi:fimbrial biogenesis outer membrane usher protein [Enterobacteriaceae bacterium 4M9]|nr:fimbrial biogenesis outer membrane usher protein [Enterobacteriaceae bacterium 4M9]